MRKPRAARLLDAEGLWQFSLKILGGRARSTSELRQKLRARAERAGDVDATVARLKELGYLDEKRFAETYASARLENEGFGKIRVLRDLRARRVAPAMAERAVQKLYQNVDEAALIEDYIRRKYRSTPLLQDDKDMASAYRKLLRAGFGPANILRVLKRIARNPELLDGFEPPAEIEEESS